MNYHNITKCDLLNGDGLRVVLWVSGCEHHCPNCQNPILQDPSGGIPFTNSDKAELFLELAKDYISGITFSGGDPLFPSNQSEIISLCKEIKSLYPTKTIWLYTGYLYEEVKDLELMSYLDVLVDGPFVEELKDPTLMWKGSQNQRVIDVIRTRSNGSVILHCGDYKSGPDYFRQETNRKEKCFFLSSKTNCNT